MPDEPLYQYDADGEPIIVALYMPDLAKATLCPFCLGMSGVLVRMHADAKHDFRCQRCGSWIHWGHIMGILFRSGIPSMDTAVV